MLEIDLTDKTITFDIGIGYDKDEEDSTLRIEAINWYTACRCESYFDLDVPLDKVIKALQAAGYSVNKTWLRMAQDEVRRFAKQSGINDFKPIPTDVNGVQKRLREIQLFVNEKTCRAKKCENPEYCSSSDVCWIKLGRGG